MLAAFARPKPAEPEKNSNTDKTPAETPEKKAPETAGAVK
jgi:hypothetical protein